VLTSTVSQSRVETSHRPTKLAACIAEQAQTLKEATIVRRLSSISKVHDAIACRQPDAVDAGHATLRGTKRPIARRNVKRVRS
jgi:hypothetical protein